MKAITVVGGGLAGLTLGVGLRREGVPVTVHEAGRYPRHRVCGEFISGRGRQVLKGLGLEEVLRKAGATEAVTAVFFLGPAASRVRPLPAPALAISRYTLDALLARRLRQEGGELIEGTRWRDAGPAEGLVWANGRRMQPQEEGWHWFGLKAHARAVALSADLEMHAVINGYVGLSRLPDGEVNICGLFRRPATRSIRALSRIEQLRGEPNSRLAGRLESARFDEASFCAVAGLALRPQRGADQAACRLGDALTMIPPVTGNGMSMAFEAAGLAIEPLARYSQGHLSWAEARGAIAQACDRAFARRLFWAQFLQWMMFTPQLQSPIGAWILRQDWLWRLLFGWTR